MSTTILQHSKGNPKIHSGVNYVLQIMTRQSRTTHIKDIMTHIWPTKANEFPKRLPAEMTLHPASDVQPQCINLSCWLVYHSIIVSYWNIHVTSLPLHLTNRQRLEECKIFKLQKSCMGHWFWETKNKINKQQQKHHPQKLPRSFVFFAFFRLVNSQTFTCDKVSTPGNTVMMAPSLPVEPDGKMATTVGSFTPGPAVGGADEQLRQKRQLDAPTDDGRGWLGKVKLFSLSKICW